MTSSSNSNSGDGPEPGPKRDARALVDALFGHIDRGEFDQLGTVFSPDVVYERPGYPRLVGADVEAFYRDLRTVRSGRHTIATTVAADGHMACCGRFDGVLKDGTIVAVEFADFYLVRGDRIVFRKTYFFAPLL